MIEMLIIHSAPKKNNQLLRGSSQKNYAVVSSELIETFSQFRPKFAISTTLFQIQPKIRCLISDLTLLKISQFKARVHKLYLFSDQIKRE